MLLCFMRRYWGFVTFKVPGFPHERAEVGRTYYLESPADLLNLSSLSQPGVTGSSLCTLTTSLAIPVPSSSSSNGPTTTPLTTRDLCPGGSVAWVGPLNVRSASLVQCDWKRTDRLGRNSPCLWPNEPQKSCHMCRPVDELAWNRTADLRIDRTSLKPLHYSN